MAGYSMSDVVALKRVDMEDIQRKSRAWPPMTPRLVSWNVNNERPNVYFPNINRTFITDLTYVPGQYHKKRTHSNTKNRIASWTPYSSEGVRPTAEEEEEEEEAAPDLSNPVLLPQLQINKPLGLLKREYKHPLSMYEEALNNMFSRHAKQLYEVKPPVPVSNPTTPRQYYPRSGVGLVLMQESPRPSGKEWVTNRWRMWSGGSSSSPP